MFKVVSIPFIAAALAAVSTLPAQAQESVAAIAPPPTITAPGSAETRNFRAIEALATRLSCPFCDLSNAQLAGRDLTDANLQGANLTGADLSGANLSGAILSRANLTNANLANANLGRSAQGPADLVAANLTGASLAGADLDGTDLQYTDLSQTDLAQVDLGRARRGPSGAAQSGGVSCGSADLSGLQNRIYVAMKGSDSDTCGDSPTAACAGIAKGLARCSGKSACGVLTLYGEYTLQNSVALVPGVNLYGGCLSDQAPQPGLQSLLTAPPRRGASHHRHRYRRQRDRAPGLSSAGDGGGGRVRCRQHRLGGERQPRTPGPRCDHSGRPRGQRGRWRHRRRRCRRCRRQGCQCRHPVPVPVGERRQRLGADGRQRRCGRVQIYLQPEL